MSTPRLLAAVADASRPVLDRVMVVVAHPDDETLGCGALMMRCQRLVLVHVTDGAPRSGDDAHRLGFASAADYAAARARELEAALAAGGIACAARVMLGVPDQEAGAHLPAIIPALRDLVARHRPALIVTHAYEGGHPDHDATACAVAQASRSPLTRLAARSDPRVGARGQALSPTGRGEGERTGAAAHLSPAGRGRPERPGEGAQIPAVLDMPLYRAGPHGWVRQRFDGATGAVTLRLGEAQRRAKRAMLAAFATQAAVLADFDAADEPFRPAPAYDFSRPPNGGAVLYESFGWGRSAAVLCRQMEAARC